MKGLKSQISLLGLLVEADRDTARDVTTVSVRLDKETIVITDIPAKLIKTSRNFNTMKDRCIVVVGSFYTVDGEPRVLASSYKILSGAETEGVLSGEALVTLSRLDGLGPPSKTGRFDSVSCNML